MDRKKAREADFIDKSVCISFANCYDSDGVASVHGAVFSVVHA
jgi:hypothetical protein